MTIFNSYATLPECICFGDLYTERCMKRTVQIASCVTLLATRFLRKKQQHVYLYVLYTVIVIYTYHRYIHIIDIYTVIHVSINKLLAFVPSFATFATRSSRRDVAESWKLSWISWAARGRFSMIWPPLLWDELPFNLQFWKQRQVYDISGSYFGGVLLIRNLLNYCTY